MKPDNKITGSVESASNVEAINIANNKTEMASSVQAETQPSVGSSSSAVAQSGHTQQQATKSSGSNGTDQDDSGTGHFESQIAQLPAEDAEVIEKEWIDKVDEIVDKTSSDPYYEDQAHHSLSKAYLKRRFNLDIE